MDPFLRSSVHIDDSLHEFYREEPIEESKKATRRLTSILLLIVDRQIVLVWPKDCVDDSIDVLAIFQSRVDYLGSLVDVSNGLDTL